MSKTLLVIGMLALILSCSKEVNETLNVSPISLKPEANLQYTYDIVVYGGTSSGIIAAVQAIKMGKSAAIICDSQSAGGMTSGGLSNTDIGNPKVIGGLTALYYTLIGTMYGQGNDHLQQRFEPKTALRAFNKFINDFKIPIYYNERLLLTNGVIKENNTITMIKMESGKVFSAKIFIDASYEGDLMAKSDVPYVIGRDANSTYNETLNGVTYPDLSYQIDPWITEGNSDSGLLPNIYPNVDGKLGQADKKVMSYNYRLCMTKDSSNRLSIEKPVEYNEKEYELVIRYISKNPNASVWTAESIPGNKYDVNNTGYFSLDYVGMSEKYPDADHASRKIIAKAHEIYIKGLIWTLQNHPRIPQAVRNASSKWGLARDEFTNNNNWPTQLYVREGRRMIGQFVMTESVIKGDTKIDDSIGMGSYPIDCHGIQYCLGNNKKIAVEGGVFSPIPGPYSISYRSITPNKKNCNNLLVPVCLSASHLAISSIRMEPQYMILGQSAAIAAVIAIDKQLSVQDIDYTVLKNILLEEKQVLTL